ncbi:glycosyl hydrolase family 28 protein [Vibrio sp. PP-XX7]
MFSSLGLLAKSQMLAAWQSQDTHWKTEAELSDLIKLTYGGYDGQVNKDLYSNRRSSLATFRGVTNVYFAELQVLNPAYHTIMFLEGENTVFAYNTVQTFDINNADGVEFGNSQNSVVFANFMDTGDDNINFAAGQGADYEEGHSDVNPVEQVWVFNNYLREGHGAIAIGSHTGAWIQDMLAEENVMFLTNNGLRMKSTTATGGGARRIVFRDNAMKDIGTHNRFQVNGVTIQNRGVLGSPFVATLSYSAGDNVFTDAEIPAQFKDILVENVTVDNVPRQRVTRS